MAFLEPRKSPIDVVQAVGRAMRRAEGKELGYIIVPVVIPPGVDAERHLAVSDKQEGWRELGDILQALRAHDTRIEDALSEILTIQLPPEPPQELPLKTGVAVGRPDAARLEFAVVTGSRDQAEDTARAAVREGRPLLTFDNAEPFDETLWEELADQPTSLIVHVERPDGSTETREDSVVRHKPKPTDHHPPVNERQTKRRAGRVAKGERGQPLPDPAERERRRAERRLQRAEREERRQAALEEHVQGMLVDLSQRVGETITMNLLEKSGLTGNKVQRDMNLLGDAVGEATRLLRDEQGLAVALDAHFEQGNLAPPRQGKPRADGATIAALLWMNAAMLHQRIHAGGWLAGGGIRALADIKSAPEPERLFRRSWNAITRQDFLPVIEPAVEALEAASDTDRLGGLRRALRHLAEQAEQIAEAYADMGTDHAGALFNKVMGDQSSDGAFFTRPVAADLAAKLTLEAVDPGNALDWSDPDVWRQHKTVDLACGSGTLLTAVMTEMKRRAALHGADPARLAELQKVAVEETLKGLDINPVSLQLAATQLMTGNTDVRYRRMGLHLMPYGLQPDGAVAAGSPELFGRRGIAGRLFDDAVAESERVETGAAQEGPQMDDADDAVRGARVVIMNPPFTNRTKMGEKFDKTVQQELRRRMDTLEESLRRADPLLSEILDRNALRPLFAALADLCLDRDHGVFSTVLPTIALTAPSGLPERIELARRFHVHTILTHMGAIDVNLSQGTDPKMNESIVVMRRSSAPSPTRIVSLDRFPRDEADANQVFEALNAVGSSGLLAEGWGEVSAWPSERIQAGDWSAVAWRSPQLADAAARFAQRGDLVEIQRERERERERENFRVNKTGPALSAGYRRSERAK